MEIAFKKIFTLFFFKLWWPFCSLERIVLAVLIEGHLSNIHRRFERNRPRGIEGVGVLRFF